MKTIRYKTNLNCGGCVAKVTPTLQQQNEITDWNVDTSSQEKVLTVNASRDVTSELKFTMESLGFKIERMG